MRRQAEQAKNEHHVNTPTDTLALSDRMSSGIFMGQSATSSREQAVGNGIRGSQHGRKGLASSRAGRSLAILQRTVEKGQSFFSVW
mmetsp:Transcript_28078/g.77222  ORF Transcript_28078/g.77222 Transcript_28078/m.77222 type:complete len:86 (-) Transcript_28078:668-925(-)